MNSKRLTAMGLIVALSISAVACSGAEEEAEEAGPVAVEVLTPKTGELTVDTAYIGTVAPQEQVYVIPKASGTVTETFFEVGDQVQEGDVLFKIDDEAAQLQMANAKAAYESAQAGVTAQNGGARDLQNFQTEEQIRQLRKSLYDSGDQLQELENDLDEIREAKDGLMEQKNQAQAGADAAGQAYFALDQELSGKIADVKIQISAKQQLIDAKEAEILAMGGESAVGQNPDVENLKKELDTLKGEKKVLEEEEAGLNARLAEAKTSYDQARTVVEQLGGQIYSIDASKTQLKSAIDQLETGQDTMIESLNTAEQAYAITQNEIYPQTDAVSSAQLHAASIGIDSAQMQLDFYTVKSPISGVVESVSVEKNGMAAAGNPAYIISNKESMTVTFHVAEKARNVLAVGDHVTVERDGAEYDGIITEIGTMTNPQTKLFQVKATVTGAGAALPNGVSVKVYAITQRDAGKLIIPYDSIYFSAGDAYVYCVENGQVVKADVTVGLMSDTEAVIEEGLTADSQVISNWSSRLRNGVEAEIVSRDGEAVVDQTLTDEPEETSVEDTDETEGQQEEPADHTEMTEEAE